MTLWYVLHHDETMSRRPHVEYSHIHGRKESPPPLTYVATWMNSIHKSQNQTGAVGSTDYAGYGPFDDLRLQGCIRFTHGDLSPRHIWCLNHRITCTFSWKLAGWLLLSAVNHPRLLRERLTCQNTLLNSLDLSPGSLKKNE